MVARCEWGCGGGKKEAGIIGRKNKLENRVLFLGPVLVTVFVHLYHTIHHVLSHKYHVLRNGFPQNPLQKRPFQTNNHPTFFLHQKVFV
jgi:hypothetical protein